MNESLTVVLVVSIEILLVILTAMVIALVLEVLRLRTELQLLEKRALLSVLGVGALLSYHEVPRDFFNRYVAYAQETGLPPDGFLVVEKDTLTQGDPAPAAEEVKP